MSEAFDKVMDGLKDARAYLNGKRDGFVVPEVKVPELDMATIWATCRCKRPRCAGANDRAVWMTNNWVTTHLPIRLSIFSLESTLSSLDKKYI